MSNNKKAESQAMGRLVRRELGRHSIDCGDVQITTTFGVIYLHGRVRPMRGHEDDVDAEIAALLKALRQTPGVRDIVTSWSVVR